MSDQLYEECLYYLTPHILYNQDRYDNFMRVLEFIPNYLQSSKIEMDIATNWNNIYSAVLESSQLFDETYPSTAETFGNPKKQFFIESGSDYEILKTILYFPWILYEKKSSLSDEEYKDNRQYYLNFCRAYLDTIVDDILFDPIYSTLLKS